MSELLCEYLKDKACKLALADFGTVEYEISEELDFIMHRVCKN